jgi:hypothetical protein
MILLIGGIIIAALSVTGYAIWLYYKERTKEICSECGERMTDEDTHICNNEENICVTCYAKQMAPERYEHYYEAAVRGER